MRSRVMVNTFDSFSPLRRIVSFTSVPRLPRRALNTVLFSILPPTKGVSSTLTILSPLRIPAASDGPPDMGVTTYTVSL